MSIFKFEQGDKVKDTITGFDGIVTARTEYHNGCIRYCIESTKRKADGDRLEIWEDEERMKLIKAAKPKEKVEARPGGARPSPPRTQNPS